MTLQTFSFTPDESAERECKAVLRIIVLSAVMLVVADCLGSGMGLVDTQLAVMLTIWDLQNQWLFLSNFGLLYIGYRLGFCARPIA